MNASLTFNPQKVTYGFLLGIAKFTQCSKTLDEVLQIINSQQIADNLAKYCKEDLGYNIESNEGLSSSEWERIIKATIIRNKYSTYSQHRMLVKDADWSVRKDAAQNTHFIKLITYFLHTF